MCVRGIFSETGSGATMAYKIQGSGPGGGKKEASGPEVPPVGVSRADVPPAKTPAVQVSRPPARLVSLDAFRGFIMTLLAAAGFGINALATSPPDAPVWKVIDREAWTRVAFHFEHPRHWNSNFLFGPSENPTEGNPLMRGAVSLWDLIQPSFMFMVGVAMPFSAMRRSAIGESNARRWVHAVIRAVILVLLGVFLYSLDNTRTDWIFPNVLAQIGLGYLFAYAVLNLKWWGQVAAIAAILIGTWIAFYSYSVPDDYDFAAMNARPEFGEVLEPPFRQWSKNGNVAHAFDVWFLNKFPRPPEEDPWVKNDGGYQTLNFVPSIATMILGILCGQILLSTRTQWKKVGTLLGIALICYLLGIAAGAWAAPIVKRIWTPSWALFSGGYVVAMLAMFYILFDILPLKKLAFPLVVVGMNSILMYLMGELLHGWVRDKVIHIHFQGVIETLAGWVAQITGTASRLATEGKTIGAATYDAFAPVIDATAVFLVFWLVAYILYRKRILVRI
jgi:predicted acyltransferase